MKNLEQIRAKNALEAATGRTFQGAGKGEVVKKIPTMIRENGILGALAFAQENDEKTGHADVFRCIIQHLTTIQKMPGSGRKDLQGFIDDLCASDAQVLRMVTTESMSYLNYLRRFAAKAE